MITATHVLMVVVDTEQKKARWECRCGKSGRWVILEATILLMDEWNRDHIARLANE